MRSRARSRTAAPSAGRRGSACRSRRCGGAARRRPARPAGSPTDGAAGCPSSSRARRRSRGRREARAAPRRRARASSTPSRAPARTGPPSRARSACGWRCRRSPSARRRLHELDGDPVGVDGVDDAAPVPARPRVGQGDRLRPQRDSGPLEPLVGGVDVVNGDGDVAGARVARALGERAPAAGRVLDQLEERGRRAGRGRRSSSARRGCRSRPRRRRRPRAPRCGGPAGRGRRRASGRGPRR